MDPITLKLLLFVLVIAVSFGGGYLIAQALRLRDLSVKIGTVLFTIGLALSPFLNTVIVEKKPWIDTLSFGIDLAGGTNLVYELDGKPKDSETVSRMVGAIRRRVDPTGTQELAIRQVGKNQIEIIIPKATPEEVKTIKSSITSVGMLEFAILATRLNDSHKNLINRAMLVKDDLRDNGQVVAGWRAVAPTTVVNADGTTIEVPNRELDAEALPGNAEIVLRQIKGKPEGFMEVLCVFDRNPKRRVTGEYLQRATPSMDDRGNPCVHFSLKAVGATRFRALTSAHTPMANGKEYKLAVLLDDKVQTAPNIREAIGGEGQITGRYTSAEVERIVNILNAGALEVPLKKDPISEFSISPLLGVDVQRKGFTALILSTVGVLLFLLVYYMWLGLLADICLVLNLILLMGAMAFIDATFTLPGLAGVVLTMGMAVDANVLIYERMREELERGSSLRMAIQNGFDKAFSSIFDGNITAMLTGVILYLIGTDQVKGFAVTLFIGLAISMYTALTVNHLMLEIIERKRWLKQFKTLSLFGVTNFDFIGKQKICMAASLVLIGIGLVIFGIRGGDNYDIDFSGGTMITMRFNEKQNADEVRIKLSEQLKTDVSLEELTSADPTRIGTTFRMRTTDQDQQAVADGINDAFGDKLVKVTVTPGTLEPIPEAKPVVPPKDKADPAVAATPEVEADPFAGGQQVELTFSAPTRLDTAVRQVSEELAKLTKADDPKVQKYGAEDQIRSLISVSNLEKAAEGENKAEAKKVLLKIRKDVTADDAKTAVASLKKTLDNTPLFDEINNFESSVAGDTKWSALIAIVASLVMIVIYVWFRFENLYFGLAAVLALVHDVLATLSMVCIAALISNTPVASWLLISDFKIDLTMIAAFLTILGYSINDTIVIFDRLREIRGKNPLVTREMVNQAVNECLSRTILTASIVFITVFILYVLGGEGIHGFAYAMVIGTIVGCYSTIYVASPAVLWLMEREQRAKNPRIAPKREPAKITK
ncbi:MAG: protein translocase subunit SecD [Planctomycetota bacterium]